MTARLYAGSYLDASLSGDALITDPPYGGRTHAGHNAASAQVLSATGQITRRAISYGAWTEQDVRDLVRWSADRIRGWRVCFTSHDLVMAYVKAYEEIGLYAFAPVPVLIPRPRLLGDGPSSWAVWLMVARPKSKEFARWAREGTRKSGCLPGMYRASAERGAPVVGAKRVSLMEEIVRDYSNPGDTVVDACAGFASTAVAALRSGRHFAGAELNPELARKAAERIRAETGSLCEFLPSTQE
jgi:hypothetical protein